MVLGIATYLSVRDQKWLSGESKETKVRRFGYRLDSVKSWQPVDATAFARDRAELEKVQRLTADLAKLLEDMRDGTITFAKHQNPMIAPHVKNFASKVGTSTRVNEVDRGAAVNTLLRFMRSVSQADVADAGKRIRYDYFLRGLAEEKLIRTQFTEFFDKLGKALK